tara:strand:+ start:6752 stop:7615 length:864 start_codon:yes stop_codon:yes gene_type:complete
VSYQYLILNHYKGASKDKKKLLQKETFERYFILIEYAEGAIALNESELDESVKKAILLEYDWAKGFLSKYLLAVIKDDELVEQQMQKQFNQLPMDPVLRMEKIAKHIALLEKFKVQDQSIYGKYIYASLALLPSSAGFLGIGNMELSNENTDKAIAAFLKAIELSNSSDEQDVINFQLALAYYKAKSYRKAFYAEKKVNGSNKGKALIICGNSVASTANKCGESTFGRKSNYWLANDYYCKAANLGEDASRNQFLNLAPTLEDIFCASVNPGDEIELPCWKEKTVIR